MKLRAERGTLGFASDASVRALVRHAPALDEADLGALAGARWMHESYARPFEPPTFAGKPNPQHLELRAYEGMGRDAALGAAPAND